MRVLLPAIFGYYTHGQREIFLNGNTILEVLDNLDQLFPGLKFRFINEHQEIRPHMKIYLNHHPISDLKKEINHDDELFIIQALSGG